MIDPIEHLLPQGTLTRAEYLELTEREPRPPLTAEQFARSLERIEEPIAAIWERPEWHKLAACRGTDSEWWFPKQGQPTGAQKRMCAGCEVRVQCEQAGRSERFGIWGGLSERQRRALRPGWRAAS